ncbi:hypothetical protein, partial [Bradyrhizobium sp. BR 10261]|uniref:hypothetical protein n=1 Tax=Bradyrhizobium sp. BR 10261 TaxID=2749992 RepID=UPI001C652884
MAGLPSTWQQLQHIEVAGRGHPYYRRLQPTRIATHVALNFLSGFLLPVSAIKTNKEHSADIIRQNKTGVEG